MCTGVDFRQDGWLAYTGTFGKEPKPISRVSVKPGDEAISGTPQTRVDSYQDLDPSFRAAPSAGCTRRQDHHKLGSGLRTGATLAVTNDERWRNFPLIEILILTDLIE